MGINKKIWNKQKYLQLRRNKDRTKQTDKLEVEGKIVKVLNSRSLRMLK